MKVNLFLQSLTPKILVSCVLLALLQGCVSKKKFQQLIDEKTSMANSLSESQKQINTLEGQVSALQSDMASQRTKYESDIAGLKKDNNTLVGKLSSSLELLESIVAPAIPGGYKSENIPRESLINIRTFGDIEDKIKIALSGQGYSNNRCFSVAGGFGIATNVETINEDCIALAGQDRFSNPKDLSKSEGTWLEKWYFGRKNRTRMLVFIISDKPYGGAENSILSFDEMSKWVISGFNTIPNRTQPFTSNHFCDVLVYEYEISDAYPDGKYFPSGYTAKQHLIKSNLWNVLTRVQ